jgi:ribonuclease-3
LPGLSAILQYEFGDERLCTQALTHRSAGNPHNERLEFLGDAMLGLVVADELYRRFPDAEEGPLTRLRAALVRKETLAEIAAAMDLGAHLHLGEGELKSGGFRRASILANALEAILGAIYLDGGYEACRAVITRLLETRLSSLSTAEMTKDPKTELQEWLQARGRALPVYRTLRVEGDPHDQHFIVQCALEDISNPVTGEGRSRRHAEQQAAERMLAQVRRSGTRER